MRSVFRLFYCGILLFPQVDGLMADTARVRLISRSLVFSASDVSYDGQPTSVEFMNLNLQPPVVNGELTTRTSTNEIGGFYFLHLPLKFYFEDISLQLPDFTDSDGNHVHDFYESAHAVDGEVTPGIFEDTQGRAGGLVAVWNRPANSTAGTCDLQFNSAISLSSWTLPYEILEYTGTLHYQRSPGASTGTLNLTRGNQTLRGGVRLIRLDADHISVPAGSWTFSQEPGSPQISTIDYASRVVLTRFGTSYLGEIQFTDGNPATSIPDLQPWIILLSDPRDENGNSLNDVLENSAPEIRLTLRSNGTKWLISAAGIVGQTCRLERSSVPTQDWSVTRVFTPTSDPFVLEIDRSNDPQSYWRVISP